MKTVFIFGAGASQEAGGPLMSGFLDCAQDLVRLKVGGVIEAKDAFDDVFNAIAELQGIHSKSYLDLNNIEIVFGAIEMGLLLRRLGKRDEESITKLRNSLITLIYKTLEYSIHFPVDSRNIRPPVPYAHFMDILKDIEENQPFHDPHKFTFITFNYDLCLDVMLHCHRRSFDYCLDSSTPNASCNLLKLHGSINWGLSENDKIVPYNVRDAKFELFPSDESVYYALGSILSSKEHEGKPLKGPPVIVPPTWNKNSYRGQLTKVWAKAASEFAEAENIFIIGYSLPETDSFFRYLYALGSESSVRLRNIVVINNDTTGDVKSRFRQLIGRGIENRFRYILTTFAGGISHIHKILKNP